MAGEVPGFVEKVLTANDTGETGSHQAGILIPKDSEMLNFFPVLDVKADNPREILHVTDFSGKTWKFNFIYYNNKFRGGTRNEYRLTCMTTFLKQINAKPSEVLTYQRIGPKAYKVGIRRADAIVSSASEPGVLKLSGGWRIITVKNLG